MRYAAILAGSLLASACGAAGREYFQPTEAQSGLAAGNIAASYDLQLAARRVGEARLYSGGAYRGTLDGQRRTLIHLAVEVENTSDAPLVFEWSQAELDAVRTDHALIGGLRPVAGYSAAGGRPVVDPGRIRRFDLHFAVPRGLDPQQVDAFRLRWAVSGLGDRYAQITPFVEEERRQGYVAYPPFVYGPYWDPFYGYGGYYRGPFPSYSYHVVRIRRPVVVVRDHRSLRATPARR